MKTVNKRQTDEGVTKNTSRKPVIVTVAHRIHKKRAQLPSDNGSTNSSDGYNVGSWNVGYSRGGERHD